MAESRGRPGSAAQRPTGGDKAVATQKKQYFRRKKVCRFCVEKIDDINYKDVKLLHAFVAERGKIIPRRISGVCAPHQRRLTDAIKKAIREQKIPIAISKVSRNGNQVTTHIELRAGQNLKGGLSVLFVAIADNKAESQVARGENAGRSLAHVAVMRVLKPVGTIDLDSATARDVTLSVPSGTNGSRLVAFVQDPKSGHVLAVAVQKL